MRIGKTEVTVGEIEDRLAEIPPFQRRLFGATPEAQVKAYVEQVVVKDALLAEGAKDKDLASQLPTVQHIRRSRSSAVLRALPEGAPLARRGARGRREAVRRGEQGEVRLPRARARVANARAHPRGRRHAPRGRQEGADDGALERPRAREVD